MSQSATRTKNEREKMRLPIGVFESALLELQRGEEVGAMSVHRAESSDSDKAGILLRDSTSRCHVINFNGLSSARNIRRRCN